MEIPTIINGVLLAVLGAGLIAGLIKGLIRQVVELVGVVGSFFVAVLFAGLLATMLQRYVSLPYSPSLAIAFLAIFVGGMIGFHFLAVSIQKLIRMTFLGWVDRFCGAALGLIIGMVVTSLLVTVTLELPVSRDVRENVERSSVSMFVRPIAPWLFNVVFSHGDRGIDYNAIFKRGGPI